MVKEIVLHIGDTKAGSTAIQDTLVAKKYTSHMVNVFYPTKNNHGGIARSFYIKSEFQERESRFSKLAQAVNRSNADIAIISSELFENVDPEELKINLERFFPAYDNKIRVLAYVRPHAERLKSSFTEQVKNGFFTGTVDEFYEKKLKAGQFFYYDRFCRWRNCFGSNFYLRPFVRSLLIQGDVVSDFLSFVFRNKIFSIDAVSAGNEALSVQELSLLREFSFIYKSNAPALKRLRSFLGWNYARIASTTEKLDKLKFALHKSVLKKIHDAYLEDAKKIDASFLNSNTLTDALNKSLQNGIDTPISLDARSYYDESTLQVFHSWLRLLSHISETCPTALMDCLNKGEGKLINGGFRNSID